MEYLSVSFFFQGQWNLYQNFMRLFVKKTSKLKENQHTEPKSAWYRMAALLNHKALIL